MGGLLRGGRRGFGSGGRAFNGAAILTRHLVAFSTRQWRRCRLGSRPPSAGRGAHCLADRTGLPGKGRELRHEQGPSDGGARCRSPPGDAHAQQRRGKRGLCVAAPPPHEAPAALCQWRAAETSGRGRCGRLVGRPRRAEGRTPRRLRDPLAGLPPAIFRASRRAGKESAPSSSAEAPPRRLGSRSEAARRPHPPLAGRGVPRGRRAMLPPGLTGVSNLEFYSRFIIDEALSQNKVEKVSGTGTSLGAELKETVTAPGRLASSCLCKAGSRRGAGFA